MKRLKLLQNDRYYYAKREEEMREMRAKGMTLESIGKKYGLSRERVRQILGNQSHVADLRREYVLRPENLRRTNSDLAKELCVSTDSVETYRRCYYYPSEKDRKHAFKNDVVFWFVDQLKDRGFMWTEAKRTIGGGIYITVYDKNLVNIHLSVSNFLDYKMYKEKCLYFRTGKLKDVDCKLLVCIAAETHDIFAMPHSVVDGKKTVRFVWPNTYNHSVSFMVKYHNRWDIIEDAIRGKV